MIIRSSEQLPRTTLLKRFPLPRNFGVSRESRIECGRTWPAPAGATRVKTFEIYRYDPGATRAWSHSRSISMTAAPWFLTS